MKEQGINWEKRFANCISDKGLRPRIYKECSKVNRERLPSGPVLKNLLGNIKDTGLIPGSGRTHMPRRVPQLLRALELMSLNH